MSEEKKIKIVLVEDEEVLLEVLESKLKKEGFEVFSARDGQAGRSYKGDTARPCFTRHHYAENGRHGVLTHMHDAVLSRIPSHISNSGQAVEIESVSARSESIW